MYEVRFNSRRAQREVDMLPQSDQERILKVVRALAEEPRPQGTEKVEDDIYRLRIGRYRLIFKIHDQSREVEIGSVRLRSERTYSRIRELFR